MKPLRYALLIGTVLVSPALAQFGAFMSGSPTLPTGVTLHDQDGGPSYYTKNGYTTAIASRTWNALGVGLQPTIIYAHGWDDPKFFHYAIGSTTVDVQSKATALITQGYNTSLGLNGGTAGSLDLLLNNGIGLITFWEFLNSNNTSDRLPGFETVGIFTYDEPTTTVNGWIGPIAGIPTTTFTATATANGLFAGASSLSVSNVAGTVWLMENGIGVNLVGGFPYWNDSGVNLTTNTYVSFGGGTGTGAAGTYGLQSTAGPLFNTSFGSETITQSPVQAASASLQDTRFFDLALAGATNVMAGNIKVPPSGSASLSTAMGITLSTPNGRRRHLDGVGSDVFWFAQGGDQGVSGQSTTFPNGIYQQQHSNNYDQTASSPAYTFAQSMKGSHYGDYVDIMRQYNGTYNQPIYQFVEPLNAKTGTVYGPQSVEINWAIWSTIIHGGLGISIFQGTDAGVDQNQCFVDSPYCTQLNSAQTTTVTGSIATSTCNGVAGQVLTTTGATTGYGLYPGTVSTAGVTGGPATILQECAPNVATATGTTGGVSSSSVTLSSISGTVQPPMRIFNSSGTGLGGSNIAGTATWITGGGPSVYTLHDNLNFTSLAVKLQANPGTNGTYLISQGTGTGSMSFIQPSGANQQVAASAALVGSLAPIIHSRFAYGLVTPSPNGYVFESGMTQRCAQAGTQSLQSNTCGTTNGIETMAKYYEGATYTATTGDVISKGFYIFSDTRYTELDTNISATFTLASQCGVSKANVIGESRSININTSTCTFTDTFANGWTVHIYQLQ